MKLLGLLSYAGAVIAGQLNERLPWYARDVVGSEGFSHTTMHHIKKDYQKPLAPHISYDTTTKRHSAKLEIESASYRDFIPFYWINIALGTPNQAFRMVLDLQYGGAIVRSQRCVVNNCGEGLNYSSDASSTSHEERAQFLLHNDSSGTSSTSHVNRERYLLHDPAQYAHGNVVRDHMQLAGLNITDVVFGSADDVQRLNAMSVAMVLYGDGALGLEPPKASKPVYTDRHVPNILHKVIDQGDLESNVMTLDLPYRTGERGSLSFGTIPDEARQGEEIRIPFSNGSEAPIKDMWQFRIDSIVVAKANRTVINPVEEYATFELGPVFSFPKKVAEDILNALGAEDYSSYFLPRVDCSGWDNMPDIVFTLNGHDVKIERDEYAFKVIDMSGREVCMVLIVETEFESSPIALGVEFMRKFYVTFDVDEEQIRLFSRTQKSFAK